MQVFKVHKVFKVGKVDRINVGRTRRRSFTNRKNFIT